MKQKLKLFEILDLEAEINGLVKDGQVLIEGLLSQEISAITKYWLNDLVDRLKKEKSSIDSVREDLIKKNGKEGPDGRIGFNQYMETDQKDQNGNPIRVFTQEYSNFMNEYEIFLQEEKEIDLPEIKLEELSKIVTKDNYYMVFKYMVKKPNKESIEHLVVDEE